VTRGRHKSGRCDVTTFRDRRIASFVEFCDTAAAAPLMAAAEAFRIDAVHG